MSPIAPTSRRAAWAHSDRTSSMGRSCSITSCPPTSSTTRRRCAHGLRRRSLWRGVRRSSVRVAAAPNKRLKLPGADRSKGNGVLCPGGHGRRPLLLRRRAGRPQRKRDPLGGTFECCDSRALGEGIHNGPCLNTEASVRCLPCTLLLGTLLACSGPTDL